VDILEAIVLGIVQGLTEFLPISSSGHLILVPWLFDWDEPGLAFDAALHLGTLVAVFSYFRADISMMIRAVPTALRNPIEILTSDTDAGAGLSPKMSDRAAAKLGLLIVIGSIPGGVIGLASQSSIESFFHEAGHATRAVVGVAVLLIVFGLVLWIADRHGSKSRSITSLNLRDVAVIGFAQAAALVPGVSRSGATMSAALWRGLKRADAARFSFLLGIPLVTGAGLKGLLDIAQSSPSGSEVTAMVAGMIAAAVSGFAAIWALLRYLQRAGVGVFVVYRIAVGIGVILLAVSGIK